MPYGPTELGLAAEDKRPYGEGAADIAAARERAQAEQTTATARPRGRGRAGGQKDEPPTPGYMVTPPPDPTPDPKMPPRAPRTTAGLDTSAMTTSRGPYSFDWPDKPPKRSADERRDPSGLEKYLSDLAGGAVGAAQRGLDDLGRAFAPKIDTDINKAVASEYGQPAPLTPEQEAEKKRRSDERGQALITGILGAAAPLALPYTTVEGEVVSHQVENDPLLKDEYAQAIAALPPEEQQRPTVRSAIAHAVIDSAVRRLLDVRDDPNATEEQRTAADAAAFAYIFERVVSFGGVQATRELGRLAAKTKVGAAAGEAAGKADAAVAAGAKKAVSGPPAQGGFAQAEGGELRLDLGLGGKDDPLNRLTTNQLHALKAVTTDEHELAQIDAALAARVNRYMVMGNDIVDEKGAVISRHKNQHDAQVAADRYNAGTPTPRDTAFANADAAEKARLTAEKKTAAKKTAPAETADQQFDRMVGPAPKPVKVGNTLLHIDDETGRIVEEPAPKTEVVDRQAPKPAATTPRQMPSPEDVVVVQGDRPASANLGINLDQLHPDLPDAVGTRIEEMAKARWEDIQNQRRGTVSWEVTFARARNMGIDVPELSRLPAGVSTNAEGAAAILDAVVKTTKERIAVEDKIREAGALASDELKAQWLTKVWEQSVLQTTFSGFRAELGRGLNILKALYKGENAGRMKDTYADAVRAMGGPKNVDQLLDRLLAIRTDPRLSPIERERMQARFVANLRQPRFWDYPKSLWINSILSWPGTHIANISGQAALIEADVIAQIPAAAYDAVFSGFGRLRPRERTVTGAITSAVVTHLSTWDAAREALLYLRTGISAEDIGVFKESGRGAQTEVFRGSAGRVLQFPTRALGAEDVFYYRLGYRREIYRAAADYVSTGKGGPRPFSKGWWLQVHDIASNPTAKMLDDAENAGKRAGLRQDPGPLAEGLLAVRDWEVPYSGVRSPRVHNAESGRTSLQMPITKDNGVQPFFYVAPFVRIGFNLASVGAEYSPLGFLRVAVKKGGARSDAAGRATVGTVVMSLFWKKAASGELTGAAPTDPKERQDFYDQGKLPYSVRVGSQWIQYDRLEPIATPLKWISGLEDARRSIAQNPLDVANYVTAMEKAAGAVSTSFLNQSFLQGIGDLVDALHSDQKAARMAANIAKGFIPFSGLLRGLAQMEDPYQRNPTGFVQQIESSLPGLSRMVKPFINSRGEPELRPRSGAGALGSPVGTSEAKEPDPVDQMLQGLHLPDTLNIDGDVVDGKNIFVGLAQKEIGSFKLSDHEGFMLQQMAGRAAYAELGKYLSGERLYPPTADGKRFDTLSDADKVKAVERAISDGRRSARAQVADSIVRSAPDSQTRVRGLLMRLSTISTMRDKADYLAAMSAFNYLDSNTRAAIDARKGKDEPTVSEYVRAGPLIREYLRLEPFQIGDAQEWKQVEAARKHQAEFNKGRTADDPSFANEFPEENALVRRYAGTAAKNPERTALLKQYPFLSRFLTGTTFTQDNTEP